MNITMPETLPEYLEEPGPLQVGDMFLSKNRRKTHYWIVVGFDTTSCHLLGIGAEGEITQAASYGRHVFEGYGNIFKPRRKVGLCHGLQDMNLQVELFEEAV